MLLLMLLLALPRPSLAVLLGLRRSAASSIARVAAASVFLLASFVGFRSTATAGIAPAVSSVPI